MTQDFDSWLAQYLAGAIDEDEAGGGLNPNWRLWLQAIFEERGPLPTADVDELMEVEARRLQAAQLDAARRLLPTVVADGHAVGMTLDVVLRLTTEHGGHLEVSASPEPGSRYYQTSSGDPMELFLTDAELLAWLADEVQEATMERDQVHCFVWPTCLVHQLGGHAVVDHGTAVWRCNGDGGHVLARIGELDLFAVAASANTWTLSLSASRGDHYLEVAPPQSVRRYWSRPSDGHPISSRCCVLSPGRKGPCACGRAGRRSGPAAPGDG